MDIRRLSWAGIALTHDNTSIVVDALGEAAHLAPLMGAARSRLAPVADPASIDYALITHAHPDHYDQQTLRTALKPGGALVCGPSVRNVLADARLRTISIDTWSERELGPFQVTAIPAVDGIGDPQVSWVIRGGGRTVIHCGDTLWHGYWWTIRKKFEPIDIAFLPINAARIQHVPYNTRH